MLGAVVNTKVSKSSGCGFKSSRVDCRSEFFKVKIQIIFLLKRKNNVRYYANLKIDKLRIFF